MYKIYIEIKYKSFFIGKFDVIKTSTIWESKSDKNV